jgi:hypothetical protein
MKFFKLTLRVWITATSLAAFMFGWVFLAHSPKPIDKTLTSGASTNGGLAPIPSLESLVGQSNAQQVNISPSNNSPFNSFSPRMRTAGS